MHLPSMFVVWLCALKVVVRCLGAESPRQSYYLRLNKIEAVLTANSFTFPSPDSTFSLESKTSRMHPDIRSAGSLITHIDEILRDAGPK